MMARHPSFDLIIASIMIPGVSGPPPSRRPGRGAPPWANPNISIDDIVKQYKQVNDYKPLLALLPDRSPIVNSNDDAQEEKRWETICEVSAKLIELKIPFYPTVSRAAEAARKLIDYYQMRAQ
jgi:hypothetical protein